MSVHRGEAARAVADLGGGTIIATVVVEAPIERVYRALTRPEEVLRWWGSDDAYRTTSLQADPRPGGRWRSEGRGADGSAFHVEGEYVVFDPPHTLVQTWRPSWDPGTQTTVTYRLASVAGGTRVTVRHDGFAPDAPGCEAHRAGWERVLTWLESYITPAPSP